MEAKWKGFERLVAAIHRAEHNGAQVTWNEKINGRQFDVTLRFKFGLYNYLTVIECKDHSDPVEVGDVDKLVTKSNDAGANKAIIVSSSGFQEGARSVAIRHGIELFTLKEANELPTDAIVRGFMPIIILSDIKLLSCRGRILRIIPNNPNATKYYLDSTIIKTRSSQKYLTAYVNEWHNIFKEKSRTRHSYSNLVFLKDLKHSILTKI